MEPTVRRPSAVALITLAALSWGLGIVLTKLTLEQLAPLDVLGVELLVGAAAVGLALVVRGDVGAFDGWPAFAALGLLEPGLSFALGDFGLDRTAAVDGSLLIASETLFAVMLARVVLGERVSSRVAFAVGVGVAGSVLVALGGVGGSGERSVLGDVLVLGGTAAAAAYTVAARRVARNGEPDALKVTAVQLAAALLVALPLVAVAAASGHSEIGNADGAHLAAALATGLLTTAIPFLLFNVAIRDVEVASGALILNLVPIIAAALAVVLLGEGLGLLQLAGGAAVVGAAFSAQAPRKIAA
jgi:drug/metabolite transporter (DMT)-like permease